jgi:hypothetical protein
VPFPQFRVARVRQNLVDAAAWHHVATKEQGHQPIRQVIPWDVSCTAAAVEHLNRLSACVSGGLGSAATTRSQAHRGASAGPHSMRRGAFAEFYGR